MENGAGFRDVGELAQFATPVTRPRTGATPIRTLIQGALTKSESNPHGLAWGICLGTEVAVFVVMRPMSDATPSPEPALDAAHGELAGISRGLTAMAESSVRATVPTHAIRGTTTRTLNPIPGHRRFELRFGTCRGIGMPGRLNAFFAFSVNSPPMSMVNFSCCVCSAPESRAPGVTRKVAPQPTRMAVRMEAGAHACL